MAGETKVCEPKDLLELDYELEDDCLPKTAPLQRRELWINKIKMKNYYRVHNSLVTLDQLNRIWEESMAGPGNKLEAKPGRTHRVSFSSNTTIIDSGYNSFDYDLYDGDTLSSRPLLCHGNLRKKSNSDTPLFLRTKSSFGLLDGMGNDPSPGTYHLPSALTSLPLNPCFRHIITMDGNSGLLMKEDKDISWKDSGSSTEQPQTDEKGFPMKGDIAKENKSASYHFRNTISRLFEGNPAKRFIKAYKEQMKT